MAKQMKIREVEKGEHRCTQTQCGYYLAGGCRACESCAAPPYIITDACKRCKSCESEAGELRWGEKSKSHKVELTLTEEEKREIAGILIKAIDNSMKPEKKREEEALIMR